MKSVQSILDVFYKLRKTMTWWVPFYSKIAENLSERNANLSENSISEDKLNCLHRTDAVILGLVTLFLLGWATGWAIFYLWGVWSACCWASLGNKDY